LPIVAEAPFSPGPKGPARMDRICSSQARRRRHWSWFAGLTGTLALLFAANALPQTPSSQITRTTAPPSPAATLANATNPLDEPLRLLAEGRNAYKEVRDYTCVLVKKERMRGQLQPENVISMKVRCEPFSVYLRWQQPKTMA